VLNITKEVYVHIEDFLRSISLEVRVNDPGNPNGSEIYELVVPSKTAPGTRFRLPRKSPFECGFVSVRVKARPDFCFKVRGSDLRCDLKINTQRVRQAGAESVRGATGNPCAYRFLRKWRVAKSSVFPAKACPKCTADAETYWCVSPTAPRFASSVRRARPEPRRADRRRTGYPFRPAEIKERQLYDPALRERRCRVRLATAVPNSRQGFYTLTRFCHTQKPFRLFIRNDAVGTGNADRVRSPRSAVEGLR